jgi:hypothetical protein
MLARTFVAVVMMLSASSAACSSKSCDDIGCSPRLELSVAFAEDGDWSVKLGAYGACDVSVTEGRVKSSVCTGAVTISTSLDEDLILIDATPETLNVSYTGVADGEETLSPSYEDQKPGCSAACLIARSPISIGA